MEDSVQGRQGILESDDERQWCDYCKDDGNEIKATGFCKQCEEYMCKDCCQAHCKPRKMKYHEIAPIGKEAKTVGRENTEKEDESEKHEQKDHLFNQSVRDICTDECPVHPEKYIEYFCKTHEELCCAACSLISHKSCENVIYIPDTVTGLSESDDFLKLTKNLKVIQESLAYNKASIKTNLRATGEINKDLKKQNATLQREIVELVGKKKADLDVAADRIFDTDSKKMKALDEKCDELIEDLGKVTTKLNEIKDTGKMCKLFVNMQRAKAEASVVKDKVREIEVTNTINRYAYEPNAKLVELKNTLDNVGNLVPEHSQKSLACHLTNIDVTSKDDKNSRKCCISGLDIVSEKYIVATDMENNSAKTIDTEQNTLVYTLQLQSAPRDVSKVTEEEVVLTLPESKLLQFLSVSAAGCMKSAREVHVGGQCYGIVCNRKELIVSFIPSLFIKASKIKILDMDGQVLKTITQKFLGSPGYLALSHDQSTLYVSDWGNATVTSLTTDGKIIATYSAEGLDMPHGLVCTRSGSVYVCGRQSKNIYQLSADCNKVQVLKVLAGPFSVAFNDKKHELYVGMENCIKVFSLI